jgi:hypothetical protein
MVHHFQPGPVNSGGHRLSSSLEPLDTPSVLGSGIILHIRKFVITMIILYSNGNPACVVGKYGYPVI